MNGVLTFARDRKHHNLSMALLGACALSRFLSATDCNNNGVDDAVDLSPGPLAFYAAPVYPAGFSGNGVTLADLNGDGKPDAAGLVPGAVAVLLNRGDGSFEPARQYGFAALGSSQTTLLTVDLDQDGDLDLAFGDYTSDGGPITSPRLWVLLNSGDGSLGPGVESPLSNGPTAIGAADFERDGIPEILVGTAGQLIVFRSAGEGTFVEAERHSTGQFAAVAVTPIDLDGDGKLDVLVTNGNEILILYNKGNGTLSEASLLGPGTSVVADDFNGDDKVDLAVTTSNEDCCSRRMVTIFLNHGDRTFTAAGSYLTMPFLERSLIAADLNGDLRPDLAALGRGENLENIVVLLNKGDGDFDEPVNHKGGSALGAFAANDIDGDEALDLIALDLDTGGVGVLVNDGTGSFSEAAHYVAIDFPGTFFYDATEFRGFLLASDLDGDRDMDLVVGAKDLTVVLNLDRGDLAASRIYPDGIAPPLDGVVARRDWGFASGDFDGDGDLDRARVVTFGSPDYSSQIEVFLNDGNGSFTPDSTIQFREYVNAIASGDYDGDGRDDLATAHDGYDFPAGLSVLLSPFDGAATYYSVEDGYAGCINPADFDGDGSLDVAIVHGNEEDKSISVFLNDGHGAFRAPVTLSVVLSVRERLWSLTAADLDQDGLPELIARLGDVCVRCDFVNGGGRAQLSLFKNLGRGNFQTPPLTLVTAGGGSIAAAADFDGDGTVDLEVFNAGGVAVHRNLTAPPFSLDVNHNGIPDECEARPHFHRGDPNTSGTTDISDAVSIFGHLFLGDPSTLKCNESADANNNGAIDISDGIYLLSWLFTGGLEPAAPGPTTKPCGLDPDPPGSPGDLGCEVYAPCR